MNLWKNFPSFKYCAIIAFQIFLSVLNSLLLKFLRHLPFSYKSLAKVYIFPFFRRKGLFFALTK
jgi:hypothetical protein